MDKTVQGGERATGAVIIRSRRRRGPEVRTLQTIRADGFPAYVVHELQNWSRWCWSGDWPHPLPPSACGSAERHYPSGQDREDVDAEDLDRPPPIHVEHAVRVDGIYKSLPLVEQRVMQFEYPRRHELGALPIAARQAAAARHIDISLAYYKIALHSIKTRVWNEFR